MAKLSPARRLALDHLLEAHRSGLYVRDVVDLERRRRTKAVDPRDAALAERLALGVTATAGCLDELLDRFIARPRKISIPVRGALRIAAFEMLYLDRPAPVAVSQGVELVRSSARSAASLANAVLHRVADAAPAYLRAEDVPPCDREGARLARSAGLPRWLMGLLGGSMGPERVRSLCSSQLEPAPLAACFAPPLDGGREGVSGSIVDPLDGPPPGPGDIVPLWQGSCRIAPPFGADLRERLSRDRAVVSDAHAQLVAVAATAPGTLLEIGAGRGTKSFVIESLAVRLGLRDDADLSVAPVHVAADLSDGKVARNLERLRAAGLDRGVLALSGDCTDLAAVLGTAPRRLRERASTLFDTVLLDAPCSGTGTMRRHPEIPWRLAAEDVESALPDLQFRLLCEAARRVAPRGQLLYATCSVMAWENGRVVERFLESGDGAGFRLEPLSMAPAFRRSRFGGARAHVQRWETPEGFMQTYPALDGFDGHFCARLVRAGS